MKYLQKDKQRFKEMLMITNISLLHNKINQ
jgi:hypothetical protein